MSELPGAGKWRWYACDEQGHLVMRIDPDGTQMMYSRGPADRTFEACGSGGELDPSQTPRPLVVAYQYDAADRVVGVTYPHGERVTYVYDPSSAEPTPLWTTTYTYDGEGRLLRIDDGRESPGAADATG